MSEFVLVELTIPAEHRDSANRCAAVFDFDTGGAETFNIGGYSADGTLPITHYKVTTAIKPHYIPMLTDPVQAMQALTYLASEYGREMPSQDDVEAFCNNVIVGETDNLQRVAEDMI